MLSYVVLVEAGMLDTVEQLIVERGAVVSTKLSLFNTMIVEAEDPEAIREIEGVRNVRLEQTLHADR